MATIHISESEAAADFAALMNRVRAGEEVAIRNGSIIVAVISRPTPPRRSISECIALAKEHEEKTGERPVLEADFAADIENIVQDRRPWNPRAWD